MSTLGEFVLMARFKGKLPVDEDDYYYPHLILDLQHRRKSRLTPVQLREGG